MNDTNVKKGGHNVLVLLVIGALLFVSGYMVAPNQTVHSHADMSEHMDISEHRLALIDHKEHVQHTLLDEGKYACCLKKPCTYCIEKTPGHGEGAECSCLDDIMNGRHPCGECIGEILEGHGNQYLKDQFAPAIAEEVGEEHLETIEKIIEQKYPE